VEDKLNVTEGEEKTAEYKGLEGDDEGNLSAADIHLGEMLTDSIFVNVAYADNGQSNVNLQNAGGETILRMYSEEAGLYFDDNGNVFCGALELDGEKIIFQDGMVKGYSSSFDPCTIGMFDENVGLAEISVSLNNDGQYVSSVNSSSLFNLDVIKQISSVSDGSISASDLELLGSYRDPNTITMYPDDPIVYDETDWNFTSGWYGAFLPKKGLLGAASSGQLAEGTTRIIVYGQETTEGHITPSSWQAAVWVPVSIEPTTRWPKYGWRILDSEEIESLDLTKIAVEKIKLQDDNTTNSL